MNESCHTESCHIFDWVMSHIWMSHVIRVNHSCHTYECVMVHVSMSHVTTSWHYMAMNEWVISHIWIRHVTHLNESCNTYELIMSHIWMRRIITRCRCPGAGFPCPCPRWFLGFPNFSMDLALEGRKISEIPKIPLKKDKESPPLDICNMLGRDGIWPWMNESCHTYGWVMSHIWTRHVTHMDETCLTYEWVMPPGRDVKWPWPLQSQTGVPPLS